MHAWNAEKVESRYESQTLGFLPEVDGKTTLQPTRVALAYRHLVLDKSLSAKDEDTLRKAREESAKFVNAKFPFETISWGCFTMMLSELGKEKELNDLLEYADERLNPTWENGGLFYPRCDKLVDDEWNFIHVEPHSGNSGVGYSRLNVKDGQKLMWENPWTSELLQSRPWIDGAGLGDGIDFMRGIFDEDKKALVVTVKSWDATLKDVKLIVRNVEEGDWAIYVGGRLKNTVTVGAKRYFEIAEKVGGEEVDIVVMAI
jgi:hypothetical protein